MLLRTSGAPVGAARWRQQQRNTAQRKGREGTKKGNEVKLKKAEEVKGVQGRGRGGKREGREGEGNERGWRDRSTEGEGQKGKMCACVR